MNGPVVSTGRVDATVTPQRTGPEQSEVCAITPLSGARIGRGLASTGTERPTETRAGYGGAPRQMDLALLVRSSVRRAYERLR